jgi:hypothetical protein
MRVYAAPRPPANRLTPRQHRPSRASQLGVYFFKSLVLVTVYSIQLLKDREDIQFADAGASALECTCKHRRWDPASLHKASVLSPCSISTLQVDVDPIFYGQQNLTLSISFSPSASTYYYLRFNE